MALYQAPKSDKLIFAPSGSKQNAQAEQFTLSTLSRASLHPSSPIPQFHAWFGEAALPPPSASGGGGGGGGIAHPETCVLSTAELPSGRVSSRVVYLKELDGRGFVVYSNWGTSRKGADVRTNPRAALCFHWEALQRQVRVEGEVEFLPREESQKYFDTRARGSRIGAWASRQSQVLVPEKDGKEGQQQQQQQQQDGEQDDGRQQLEGWVKEVEQRFEGTEQIPVPDFWGGMRILPSTVEFWQGRESRLHDRFVYEKEEGGEAWTLNRLSP